MAKYHQNQGRSIFEEECTKQALTEMGNPLDVLSQVVDFEIFRKEIEATILPSEMKSGEGRPSKD